MASIEVYNQKKQKVETRTLGAAWEKPAYRVAVYEAALWHLNGRRAGTASTKGRSEVRGSGRKIYRQKGTGNARHADKQAPIFVGGGIVGGPKPRDYSYVLPKQARRSAIRSVLIDKLKKQQLHVVDALDFGAVKTKYALEFLEAWGVTSALLVLDKPVQNVILSVRNIPHVQTVAVDSLNVADVLSHQDVVLTRAALDTIEKLWVN